MGAVMPALAVYGRAERLVIHPGRHVAGRGGRAAAHPLADVIAWWYAAAVIAAKKLWDELPGPWWVKLLLIAATQVIPGQVDDFLLFGAIKLARWFWRRHGAAITAWTLRAWAAAVALYRRYRARRTQTV